MTTDPADSDHPNAAQRRATADDEHAAAMARAMTLADNAISLTEPNPRVGCVLVAPDGRWIGEGHTQAAGSAHAEVMALRDAQARGHDTDGATAYVTLEPCAHHGRTPPCCDALVAARIARVVIAAGDPNPLVNGQGVARLRAAGIVVAWAADEWRVRCHELNIGFFARMQRGRPWVRMKIAASLDGRTALDNGVSQWITGDAARRDGHAWRRRASVLLTGSGTVLADDPRLDVRDHVVAHQPWRVIVDSTLVTPPRARIFDGDAPVMIVTARPDPSAAAALQQRGADIVACAGIDGRVDLPALMALLAQRQCNEVHVEAGARLNAALLQAGLVDELLVYQAPLLVGPGRGMAGMAALTTLTELSGAQRFVFHRVDRLGNDLRMLLRRPSESAQTLAA